MATNQSAIQQLYADVVADLQAFLSNQVLLPNPQLTALQYNITGATGNQIRIPISNQYTAANSSVAEGESIIANAAQDFSPGAVTLTMSKRGAGSFVTSEALEDGGMDTVRNAILTRLSGSLAQATDQSGFNLLASGSEAALTDIANVDLVNDSGLGNSDLANADVSFVMSPQALAFGEKRGATVKMWEDVDRDRFDMVATVRNGFVRVPTFTGANVAVSPFFARAVIASDTVAEANANLRASLEMISTSVANLRKINAPTDASGFYAAIVSAAHEFHLASQLSSVNVGSGSIGDLSVIGNQALLQGLIGQAVGCRFFRSNNVPSGLASA